MLSMRRGPRATGYVTAGALPYVFHAVTVIQQPNLVPQYLIPSPLIFVPKDVYQTVGSCRL